MRRLVIVLLVAFVVAAYGSVALAATPDQVREIARDYWVPGSYVRMTADRSELPAARELRTTIALLLDAGLDTAEIRDVLVKRYGESILAAPPARGINLAAWVMPLLALLAGAIVVVWLLAQWVGRYQERNA